MNAEELIRLIMEYYDVHTLSELSKIINIGQPAISKWKKNNSINTIKKKCRELGIYTEIFGNLNLQTQKIENQNGNNAFINNGSQQQTGSNSLNSNEIDNATLTLFQEAYNKAKEKKDINDLRIYLMDYN